MIEWNLNTGVLSNPLNYFQEGNISAGIASLLINDRKQTEVAINGIVYNETIPIVTTIAQTQIISNSGDFFISGFQMRNETGFFDASFGGDIWQDRINGDQNFYFYENNTWTGLLIGFSGIVNESLSGDHVFLNGQKLISGEDYVEDSNGAFSYIGDTGATGVLFTMPKINSFYSSGDYDLSGVWFNEKASIGYHNGVKIDKDDVLETSSIVSSIVKGAEYYFGVTGTSINISL